MNRLPWKPGPAERSSEAFLSATRFTYRRLWQLPLVSWHGLELRRQWADVAGAIGMFIGADALKRTTYTLTAWRSEEAFRQWLASPYHARLMRDYRSHLESSTNVSWRDDAFRPEAAWREAISRLREEGVTALTSHGRAVPPRRGTNVLDD